LALDLASNPFLPTYGEYESNDHITDLISPPLANRTYVLGWMTGKGFNCVDKGDYIPCSGDFRDVDRVFKTHMKVYKSWVSGNYFDYATRSNVTHTLPTALEGYVEWVDGLSNHLFPVRKPRYSEDMSFGESNYTSDTGYVGREVNQRLYSLGDALANHNSSAAAIEFQDGGYTQSSLDATLQYSNLAPNKVTCSYGTNSGSDIETMLDMDMLADTAGGARLCYLNYPDWIYEFAVGIQNMSDAERPDVVSISYGWSEVDQCSIVNCNNATAKQYIDRANVELAKLGLLGVTVVVSSGDAGAPGRTSEDCDSDNPINPVFPGSSPYVVSAGATFVVADNSTHNYSTPLCKMFGCANGTQSKVVNFNEVGWTSGSGFTIYPDTRPNWQSAAVEEYLNSGVYLPPKSTWNSNGRGYPDIVANGHNCPVYDAYGGDTFTAVDGTSCSAPVFAAMLTLLNDYQVSKGRPKLGFVNPLLYATANHSNSPFSRPLGGNTHCTEYGCCSKDFGFQSPPNETVWDPVTGLGQLNVTEMKSHLDTIFLWKDVYAALDEIETSLAETIRDLNTVVDDLPPFGSFCTIEKPTKNS
jgi:tripeptidyl-peptidase-1